MSNIEKLKSVNIDTLKSTIASKGGFANPNRFEALINLPSSGIVGRKTNVAKHLEILMLSCESLTFPGRQIESLDYSMYRNTIKIPTGYINDEVNVTFRLTEDMYAKNIFDAWQRCVVDQETYKARYFDEYTSQIEFHHLNKKNEKTFSVFLDDCYPITVGAVEKSNESMDEILKMQVTLACRDIRTSESQDAS